MGGAFIRENRLGHGCRRPSDRYICFAVQPAPTGTAVPNNVRGSGLHRGGIAVVRYRFLLLHGCRVRLRPQGCVDGCDLPAFPTGSCRRRPVFSGRQRILYILSHQEPDSEFEVDILETILNGAEHCRFRITKK